jgi:hypothetical protein
LIFRVADPGSDRAHGTESAIAFQTENESLILRKSANSLEINQAQHILCSAVEMLQRTSLGVSSLNSGRSQGWLFL